MESRPGNDAKGRTDTQHLMDLHGMTVTQVNEAFLDEQAHVIHCILMGNWAACVRSNNGADMPIAMA